MQNENTISSNHLLFAENASFADRVTPPPRMKIYEIVFQLNEEMLTSSIPESRPCYDIEAVTNLGQPELNLGQNARALSTLSRWLPGC